MATGLIDIVKRAALDVMANEQLCDLRYGTVVDANPLRVQITSQLTIPSSLLVVPERLTDHKVSVTVDWKSDTSGEHSHMFDVEHVPNEVITDSTSIGGKHDHGISGTKTITIHNALKVGDKVVLLRKQGGQSYFILDRI